MHTRQSLVVSAIAGLVIALAGLLLAELFSSPEHGHRINTAALPMEARSIRSEQPGTPITSEQWRRLDRVMAKHGGWPSGGLVLAASIRHSWFWFLLLPAVTLGALFIRRRAPSVAVALLIAGPSLLLVAFGLSATSDAVLATESARSGTPNLFFKRTPDGAA